MRTDKIVEEVRQDLLDRSKRGQEKYGTTLDRNDLDASEWAQHLYEELLDAALYSRRLHREINRLRPTLKVPVHHIADEFLHLEQIRMLGFGWELQLRLHRSICEVLQKYVEPQ